MEIIKGIAKPRFKYFCTGYYRFGLLTAIHKAMEVIELRTASIKSI
jgi:hypothetical protein